MAIPGAGFFKMRCPKCKKMVSFKTGGQSYYDKEHHWKGMDVMVCPKCNFSFEHQPSK